MKRVNLIAHLLNKLAGAIVWAIQTNAEPGKVTEIGDMFWEELTGQSNITVRKY